MHGYGKVALVGHADRDNVEALSEKENANVHFVQQARILGINDGVLVDISSAEEAQMALQPTQYQLPRARGEASSALSQEYERRR